MRACKCKPDASTSQMLLSDGSVSTLLTGGVDIIHVELEAILADVGFHAEVARACKERQREGM